MKTQFVAIVLCLWACAMIQAQIPSLEWGEAAKRNQYQNHKMIGSDGQNHWVLDYTPKQDLQLGIQEMSLKKYDKGFRLIKEKELATQIESSELSVNRALVRGKEIWLFLGGLDKGKGVKSLWLERFSIESLERIQKPYKIESLKFENPRSAPFFEVITSPDLSLLMIRSFISKITDVQNLEYVFIQNKLTVLDAELRFVWEKSLDYEDIFGLRINNDGLVVGSAVKKIKSKSRPGILILAEEGTSASFHEVEVEEKIWARNFQISFMNDEEAFAYLLTKDKSLYAQKINYNEESFVWRSQFSLEIEIEDEFEDFRFTKELGKVTDRVAMKTKAPLFASDGSIYLVGDTYTIGNEFGGEIQAYSGDILALRISPEGELDWEKTIEKAQQLSGIYFSTKAANLSFNAFISPDQNLSFIYNDCAKNHRSATKYELGWLYNGTKADAVTMCQLSPSGKVQHQMLYNFRNHPFDWVPESLYELEDGQYVMYAFSRKQISMGRLSW